MEVLRDVVMEREKDGPGRGNVGPRTVSINFLAMESLTGSGNLKSTTCSARSCRNGGGALVERVGRARGGLLKQARGGGARASPPHVGVRAFVRLAARCLGRLGQLALPEHDAGALGDLLMHEALELREQLFGEFVVHLGELGRDRSREFVVVVLREGANILDGRHARHSPTDTEDNRSTQEMRGNASRGGWQSSAEPHKAKAG